ncbi:MAG TPA: alpha/beta fold hydrolase [Roseiflexaceae bacterium]|nr:alpha/beta fold hydrolase [Roseiflexaceae bacterium]
MSSTPSPEQVYTRPGAEPFFMPGGSVGVLLLHGYFGSPGELHGMGEALNVAGYSVHAPMLAGHGGLPAAMAEVRWQHWVATAEAGLRRLREQCDAVFVAGISMGALLALHLAANTEVAGVIAMAPALRLRGERQMALTGMLKYVMPWFYPFKKANFNDPQVVQGIRQWLPDADLNDPKTVADIRREARIPVASIYELVKLQRRVQRELPRVCVPVLLMQGRRDEVVDTRWVEEWKPKIGAADVELRWFERSGHVLPNDSEREAVWAAAVAWLGAHADQRPSQKD